MRMSSVAQQQQLQRKAPSSSSRRVFVDGSPAVISKTGKKRARWKRIKTLFQKPTMRVNKDDNIKGDHQKKKNRVATRNKVVEKTGRCNSAEISETRKTAKRKSIGTKHRIENGNMTTEGSLPTNRNVLASKFADGGEAFDDGNPTYSLLQMLEKRNEAIFQILSGTYTGDPAAALELIRSAFQEELCNKRSDAHDDDSSCDEADGKSNSPCGPLAPPHKKPTSKLSMDTINETDEHTSQCTNTTSGEDSFDDESSSDAGGGGGSVCMSKRRDQRSCFLAAEEPILRCGSAQDSMRLPRTAQVLRRSKNNIENGWTNRTHQQTSYYRCSSPDSARIAKSHSPVMPSIVCQGDEADEMKHNPETATLHASSEIAMAAAGTTVGAKQTVQAADGSREEIIATAAVQVKGTDGHEIRRPAGTMSILDDANSPLDDDGTYAEHNTTKTNCDVPSGALIQEMDSNGKQRGIVDSGHDMGGDFAIPSSAGFANLQLACNENMNEAPLKDDPKYAKYFRMLKVRLPLDAVKQAMKLDGQDPDIIEMDPEKSLACQVAEKNSLPENEVPLKDDSNYAKYFRMLKVKVPLGAVKQAMERDGQDPAVLDMDPEKSLASQTIIEKNNIPETDVLLKDDPNYIKHFGMLKTKVPLEAVRHAMEQKGQDPVVLDTDPEKSLACQVVETSSIPESDVPPKDDPNYAKYFRMLNVGVPLGAVKQAMERDGHDPAVLDMNPEKSAAGQTVESSSVSEIDVSLKDDPSYSKYFRMLNVGVPLGAVKQAMERDGLDANMIEMDPEKSLACQTIEQRSIPENDVPLKDDPNYAKYFGTSVRLPLEAVKQTMERDGKYPTIIDMDPEKSVVCQTVGKSNISENDVQLKEGPTFAKYFTMMNVKVPSGVVGQAVERYEKDPNITEMTPEKQVADQATNGRNSDDVLLSEKPEGCEREEQMSTIKQETRKDGKDMLGDKKKVRHNMRHALVKKNTHHIKTRPMEPRVVQKRLFWNPIDESKLGKESLWSQANPEQITLEGLEYDEGEFASLFTERVSSVITARRQERALGNGMSSTPSSKQKVQLIDNRRNMNGSILLAKFKTSYRTLAHSLDEMNCSTMDSTQLRALRKILPTKEEARALRQYLPPPGSPPEEKEAALRDLGDCERYMAAMMDVVNVSRKLDCVLYRTEFNGRFHDLMDEVHVLGEACDSVRSSDRLRRLMVYILRLGNQLNSRGGGRRVVAGFSIDSLLRLNETKAFDKETTVLHYLVSIVRLNDSEVLHFREQLSSVEEAERVVVQNLSNSLENMLQGLQELKQFAKQEATHLPPGQELKSTLSQISEHHTYIREVNGVSHFDSTMDDEGLNATSIGRFALRADLKLNMLSQKIDGVKEKVSKLLRYFGEDEDMPSHEFFATLNRFISLFEKACEDVKRKEEAKSSEASKTPNNRKEKVYRETPVSCQVEKPSCLRRDPSDA